MPTSWLADAGVTLVMFLIAVSLICLILGTSLQAIPVIYLAAPVSIAIVEHCNIDSIHCYIVFGARVALGLLTPPVRVGRYTAAAIKEASERALRAVPVLLLVGLNLRGADNRLSDYRDLAASHVETHHVVAQGTFSV
ncbi:MAG: TRAP-type C4-dicarboxylate transport system permease large subunit [Gammaproteobacteria bacterium]|jgi:TRAP-type C4-dicarboxylate transport system permease large subunit